MIVGIGIDVVDIVRFERSITRTPALVERLFAESERTALRGRSQRDSPQVADQGARPGMRSSAGTRCIVQDPEETPTSSSRAARRAPAQVGSLACTSR